MKKFLTYLAAVLIAGIVAASIWFSCPNKYKYTDNVFDVENIISADSEFISNQVDSLTTVSVKDSLGIVYNIDYFEAIVEMTDDVDTLNVFSPYKVTTIFQVEAVDTVNNQINPTVYSITTVKDSVFNKSVSTKTGDFWMGDFNLLKDTVNIKFADAFNLVKSSSYTLPKSRFITLRDAIGPSRTNTQYIFGNDLKGFLYVDSKDSTVTDTNPISEE